MRRPAHILPADRGARRRLAVAGVLSLLVHGAVAAVFAARPVGSDASIARLELDERPEEAEQQPEEPPVRLGSQTSTATSITWIGADEPEPGAAPTGDVDQAAFRTDLAAAPAPESVEPTPPPTPQPASPAVDPSPTETAQAEPIPDPARALPVPPTPEPVFPDTPAPIGPPLPTLADAAEPDTQSKIEQPPVEQASEPRESTEPAAQPQTPPAPPAPESAPTPSEKAVGEVAEKESDFSSTVRAPVAKLGKPLAAQGLEILTVAPRFSHYTRITSAPRDPVVRVHFGRDGRARKVELLRSSGVRDVDRPILDAVYQWRARGKQLERLPETTREDASEDAPGTTLPLEISILL